MKSADRGDANATSDGESAASGSLLQSNSTAHFARMGPPFRLRSHVAAPSRPTTFSHPPCGLRLMVCKSISFVRVKRSNPYEAVSPYETVPHKHSLFVPKEYGDIKTYFL